MIKRAVLSYFNAEESFDNKAGFNKFSDFLYTTALSVICASRQFEEVQVISSSWGVDLFKEFGLPVTEYSTKLNQMKGISRFFWAYGKLIAYCEQKKPFVHLDNDVFLWAPLPDRILKAKLCFQSLEPFDAPGYGYYDKLKPCFEVAPVRPQTIVDNPVDDFAYNCGICGGNDLRLFKEWKRCSEEYIFAKENQVMFFKDFADMLIHQNLFHEQYFIASLIKRDGLRDKVEILHDDAMKINEGRPENAPIYTHLWGTGKQNTGKMSQVRMVLFYHERGIFEKIDAFCKKNNLPL